MSGARSLALLLGLGLSAIACASASAEDKSPSSDGAASTPSSTPTPSTSSSPATADSTSTGDAASGITFGDLSFSAYHTQEDIHAYLSGEATKHPDFVTFAKLGDSRQGRAIEYITLSNKDASTVPSIYLNGTHHGDEWSSTESILGLADYLITHHTDAAVKSILDSYAVVLQPLVNPDGHQAKTREDSTGVDPNRDYEYPTGDASTAFQVPEIALVRDLLSKIKPHGAAAYHSGIQEVLWSWCYTPTGSSDAAVLEAAGKATAQAMGFDRYLQSYDDYATTGEFIDYAYQQYGTLALTFEVSTVKTPPTSQLNGVVVNSIKGAMAFMDMVQKRDSGALMTTQSDTTRSLERRGSLGAMGVRTTPRLE